MQHDVTHINGKCNTCNTHHNVPLKDHPAQPINPTSVFVIMDSQGGTNRRGRTSRKGD
jgi:hypothetical protein